MKVCLNIVKKSLSSNLMDSKVIEHTFRSLTYEASISGIIVICSVIFHFNVRVCAVGYTTDDLQFMWQSGDPVQMEEIALPQFDIKQEDIEYGNCTKFYAGTGKSFHFL